MECAAGGEWEDFFEEDAVGDDLCGTGKFELSNETLFISVKDMEARGVVEHPAIAEREGEAFFEGSLLEGPGVEHTAGA